jgi:hypothetical protein
MFVRALMLGLAVFAFASTGVAQTSPGSWYAQQKMRLELMEKRGQITSAQRQAMELKLLQQMRGQGSSGPKTGVYPNQPMQGGMPQGNSNSNTAAAQQAATKAQAEKSREALKRKAEAKKGKKKADKDDGDDNKKEDDKKVKDK